MTGRHRRCGNDPRAELTDVDRAILAWFAAWLQWDALPPEEKANTPEPADPSGWRPIANGGQNT